MSLQKVHLGVEEVFYLATWQTEMFKQFYWFGLLLLLAASSRVHRNKNTTYVEPKSASDILNRFHQNDYQIKFEWLELVRVNQRYGDYDIRAFKYNRTVTALNATFLPHLDLGYDVEFLVQAYKFASNEYRVFPIRLQFNFCESISKNVIGYGGLAKCGNFSCPFLKGKRYYYSNWTPDESMFPPFIPTGSYMLEVQATYHSDEIYFQKCYGSVSRSIV